MGNYTLNNITAPDAYTQASTLTGLPVLDHVNLDVVNGAIYWRLQQTDGSGMEGRGTWGSEVFMLPGSRVLDRRGIVGIQIRAAVPLAGLPAGASQAQVTVEAIVA